MIRLSEPPVVFVDIRVRAPVERVFQAFVDPAVTTHFWFTKSSGKLEAGGRVRWDWEMYGVGADVEVKAIEPNRRILIEWSFPNSNLVEFVFTPRSDGSTQVAITNDRFKGDCDAAVAAAIESMGGFAFVLSGLKAWLEHGLELNLIEDKFPDKHVPSWSGS